MGDLDPAKVRAAVLRGLAPLEQRIAALKSKKAAKAWARLNEDTAKLLNGDSTVDEWKASLGQFGGIVVKDLKDPAQQTAIISDVNLAAAVAEEAFDPPAFPRWLIFGGLGAAALAYWWMKREEKQREIPIATPQIIAGSPRTKKIKAVIEEADDEIEDAEFEEIP